MRLQRKLVSRFSIILLLFLATGCQKDETGPTCTSLGVSQGAFGWVERHDSAYVAQPDFNPDNPDEFLFMHLPINAFGRLYSYNMRSKTLRLIYSGRPIVYRPRWGRNGWILLNLNDGNIWKIKDNGDSLTQLTFTGGCYHPHWNYNYTLIGYSTFYWGYIMDTKGQVADTLEDNYSWAETSTWLSPRYIAYIGSSINIYVPSTNEFFSVREFPDNWGLGYGIVILKDDNNLIWSHKEGIYQTNIATRATHAVYPSCVTRRFFDPSYAPSVDKMIWQRLDYRPVSDSSLLYIKSSIVMMNVDGTGREVIEIPLP